VIIEKLPKTRSGKIARATLKNMLNNKPFKVYTICIRNKEKNETKLNFLFRFLLLLKMQVFMVK
jgi:hypothetical protein